MKKHSHKKLARVIFRPKVENRSFWKKAGIAILVVGLFFSSMYGFRCLVTKVCESHVIDKFVRDDMTILMPKGAVTAEVANTRASRELGLSFRNKMQDNEGMLFVFPVPGRYGFWMKDMSFPLDVMWINENGVVVSIERNLGPESYPKAYINHADASYVLEINAGLAERFGVYMGSKIRITD